MTIANIQRKIREALAALYEENEARMIAGLVMESITGFSGMQLLLNRTNDISVPQEKRALQYLEALLLHKPVQYVLGEAWFMNMNLYVNDSVLIPRPETEEMVRLLASDENPRTKKTILDIGTGSGCIAIGLKKLLPLAMIHAVDISQAALEVARKNAASQNCFIVFHELDFLAETQWPQLESYDLIISNPPYIPAGEKEKIDRNVIDWEPAGALFVPEDDPLLFYRKIAVFCEQHLNRNGRVYLETHQDYAGPTKTLLEENDFIAEVLKDMYENDRMIVARK